MKTRKYTIENFQTELLNMPYTLIKKERIKRQIIQYSTKIIRTT